MGSASKVAAKSKVAVKSKVAAKKPRAVRWAEEPAAHDYPAAESYLRLIADPELATVCSTLLLHAPTVQQHAKDILRAATLPLLPPDDPEVAKDLRKIRDGIRLAPVLLIRGDIAAGRPMQIADGYHRVCASYHVNEDTEIPCRLAALPAPIG